MTFQPKIETQIFKKGDKVLYTNLTSRGTLVQHKGVVEKYLEAGGNITNCIQVRLSKYSRLLAYESDLTFLGKDI